MARAAPIRRFPAQPLTENELSALLKQCSVRAPTGIRNRALIAVMYRCGLRISEALDLRVADIDPDGGTVRVLHGKGNKARTVGTDDGTVAMVQRWVDVRAKAGIPARVPTTVTAEGERVATGKRPVAVLFCTLSGESMSNRYVRDMLKRIAAKAGLEKRVHPHGLRHSFAASLIAEGVPVNTVSKALGHANSSVTARYIDHIAPADVIAMGRARQWNPEGKN
jgi:site-specific recombinase XerD